MINRYPKPVLICSFLPSPTEIVCALGFENNSSFVDDSAYLNRPGPCNIKSLEISASIFTMNASRSIIRRRLFEEFLLTN